MIVPLTGTQYAIVQDALIHHGRDDIAAWFDDVVVVARGAKQMHSVCAPAVAWKHAREGLIDWTYGSKLRTSKRSVAETERCRRVTRTVAEATAVREAHPAMRGLGLRGVHNLILPAWGLGNGTWSPYPIPGIQMVVLTPHSIASRVGPVTRWLPSWAQMWDSEEQLGEIYSVSTHLRFAKIPESGQQLVDVDDGT